jgi:hypothetical protein
VSRRCSPHDFDGIIAGAPANPFARQHAGALILTTSKSELGVAGAALLKNETIKACDEVDGVKAEFIHAF